MLALRPSVSARARLLPATALALLLAACGREERASPEVDHDFGVVAAGSVHHHVWRVDNPGARALRVTSLKPSCGCAVPTAAPLEVPPNGSTEVAVKLDTAGREGARDGWVDVELTDADAHVERRRLTFRYATRDWVLPTPRRVEVGPVAPGATATATLRLVATDGVPFAIDGVVPPVAGCVVTAPTAGGPPRVDHELTIAVSGEGAPGPRFALLEIALRHEAQPRLRLPLDWKVVAAWKCDPEERLSFGRTQRGDTAERVVRVAARDGDPAFRVLGAKLLSKRADVPLDFLSAVVRPGARAGEFEVVVKQVGDPPSSYFLADLVIETDDADAPSAKVAVYGLRGEL